MLGRLFLLFTCVTLLELAILIPLGQAMGLPLTLALVIGTGFLGAWLAKQEGLRIMLAIQERLARGGMPGDEMLDGMFVLVAGAFLLTPGVLTDVLGFLMIIPATRAPMRKLVRKRFSKWIESGKARVVTIDMSGKPGPGAGDSPFREAPFAERLGGPVRRDDKVYRNGDVIDITPANEETTS